MPRQLLQLILLCGILACSFRSLVADDVSDTATIWPIARCGPFFRIRLMLDPHFRDGFEPGTDVSQVAVKVFKQLDLRDERFRKVVDGTSNSTSEEDAKKVMDRLKSAFEKAASDTELEIRVGFTQNVYEKLLKVQLGLNGVYGLTDPALREAIGITDPEQHLRVAKCIEKNKRSSSEKAKPSVKSVRDNNHEPDMETFLSNARMRVSDSKPEPAFETDAKERASVRTSLGYTESELQERDDRLRLAVWELLSDEQKSNYRSAVSAAAEFLHDIEQRTSSTPLFR